MIETTDKDVSQPKAENPMLDDGGYFAAAFRLGGLQYALEEGLALNLALTLKFSKKQIQLIREKCKEELEKTDRKWREYKDGK